jgi:hypothetical protein
MRVTRPFSFSKCDSFGQPGLFAINGLDDANGGER